MDCILKFYFYNISVQYYNLCVTRFINRFKKNFSYLTWEHHLLRTIWIFKCRQALSCRIRLAQNLIMSHTNKYFTVVIFQQPVEHQGQNLFKIVATSYKLSSLLVPNLSTSCGKWRISLAVTNGSVIDNGNFRYSSLINP